MIVEHAASILKHAAPADPLRRKAFYDEYGFLIVRGAFPEAECAGYREELHALAARLQRQKDIDATWRGAWLQDAERKRVQVLHCHDVQFYLGSFSRLLVDPRLLDPVEQLIGPNIQLHHTKMFIKPPETGAPFPLHQDYPYFPHRDHTMLAAVLHLDDAPVAKGCLRVAPASHKLGPQPTEPDGLYLSPQEWPLEKAVPVPCRAGDLLIFNYLLIHGSGSNESAESRTTCLFQMRNPSDPPTEARHQQSRGQGMILRGIDPLAGAG
ncbi:MAG TPA: phytanoyl-CoA dioxygenase family protein [Armatimonadota bacterium]|nr:phytanoyl-CoA dioxygenase family protein [Armatimonadota bacterium]